MSDIKDAMNEVAWCYLEGYGCKKDKVRRRLVKSIDDINFHASGIRLTGTPKEPSLSHRPGKHHELWLLPVTSLASCR